MSSINNYIDIKTLDGEVVSNTDGTFHFEFRVNIHGFSTSSDKMIIKIKEDSNMHLALANLFNDKPNFQGTGIE